MSNKTAILSMLAATSMMWGQKGDLGIVHNEPRKKHWKETQDDEEREAKLKAAEEKRLRKAKKKEKR